MSKETHVNKIGHFLLVFPFLLMTHCISKENKKEVVATSDTNKALTYREMINKPLIVDFGKSKIYEIGFQSDTSFYWKGLKKDSRNDEKTKTIVLDDYKVLTHWIEKDSTIVSILTDFENMTVNGFETFKNYKAIYLIGNLTVKE